MKKEKLLLDTVRILEKFPGKGGWTFARMPEIKQHPENPFGWVQVQGSIDGYPLQQYKLMPMGNGQLFLPVKAVIRKKIKKQAGDEVHITLYADTSRFAVPDEIRTCMELEEKVIWQRFTTLTDGEKKQWCDWVYHAKTEKDKAERIATLIRTLERNATFSEKQHFSIR